MVQETIQKIKKQFKMYEENKDRKKEELPLRERIKEEQKFSVLRSEKKLVI